MFRFLNILIFFYDWGVRPPSIGGPRRLPSLPMPKAGPGLDHGPPFTTEKVKKKWFDLKSRVKKDVVMYKNEAGRTGGGQNSSNTPTEFALEIFISSSSASDASMARIGKEATYPV